MNWVKRAVGGIVSEDGKWAIRTVTLSTVVIGHPVYWLYQVGVGRYTPTGDYDDVVSFNTCKAAKQYAEKIKPMTSASGNKL